MNYEKEILLQEIMELAMRDELFAPETISLEPCGKSLTVRPPEKAKHFRIGASVNIPCWNEDEEIDCEIDNRKAII